MRKLLVACCLMALLSGGAAAQGIKIGVGFSAGMDVPIGQEDQKSGSLFGFRARVKLLPAIGVEPNLFFTKYGQPSPEGIPDYDLPGSKITAYGVDLTLGAKVGGPGVKPFGILGAGHYTIKRDEADQKLSKLGWSAGLGVEVGVTSVVGLDVRGKLVVIPTDGGDSKKSASLTAGITYYLGN